MLSKICRAAAAVLAFGASVVHADVSLPSIMSDGMVLQRNSDAAIWGFGRPGERVTVTASWTDAKGTAVADGRGIWRTTIPTGEAGGPYTLTAAGETSVTVSDILLGEVWICGGQSNMEWPLSASDGGAEAIASADHPEIRLFDVPHVISAHPRVDVEASWKACSPGTVGSFSGVGYFFGARLHQELGVPIGLVSSNWGGTRAEAWASGEALRPLGWYDQGLDLMATMGDPQERERTLAARRDDSGAAIDRASGMPEAWRGAGFDDASWGETSAPATMDDLGLGGFDGFVYFRRTFTSDRDGAGVLTLGAIDDQDDVWINGKLVGGMHGGDKWNVPRRYEIPAGVIKRGENTIAVRMLDTGGPGNFGTDAGLMKLTLGNVETPLAGTWRWKRGAGADAANPSQDTGINQHTPTALYNGMIAPITPYSAAGAIWYQGESNRYGPDQYERLLSTMIEDWRKSFGRSAEEFAFEIVQLAPYTYGGDAGQTAMVREAQRLVAERVPNCGLVVTMDVGNPRDIHPRDKTTVGERLARLALADTYGRDILPGSPMPTGVEFRGGEARVKFKNVGGGLVAGDGGLRFFTLAGEDGTFHVAEAKIDGDTVVVSTPSVKRAVGVRYGWDDDCDASLFNKEGLPASPFRFDDFPINAPVANADEMGRLRTREAGFTDLFNGRDLSGWVNVNCAPDTFTVRDGVIACTGKPTGVIRTTERYENYVLEMEYRHLQAGGNAGLFIWSDPVTARGQPFTRSVEVQVMDGLESDWYTSDGDIFPIHGAVLTPLTLKEGVTNSRAYPIERRAFDAPLWNHYRLECNNGSVTLAVNGRVVTRGEQASPREGYICLESEGSPAEFRNIRIKQLPGSRGLSASDRADEARGFRPIYTGVDLSGWKVTPENEGHWQAADWVLRYDGKGQDLWSERSYKDFTLIADWRWTGKAGPMERPVILANGDNKTDASGNQVTQTVQDAGDSGIYLRGSSKSQVNIWCWPCGSGEVYGYRTDGSMPAEVRAGVTPKVNADAPIGQWNRFEITMVGDRLTVVLNGETVLDRAQLPGVAEEGPIALQNHGAPIEFANLMILEHDGARVGGAELGAEHLERKIVPAAYRPTNTHPTDGGAHGTNVQPEWRDLFNGEDLSGWAGGGEEGAWTVKDGELMLAKPGKGWWLRTDRMYRDFELELDFFMPEGGNSGLGLRGSSNGDPAFTGMEIQMLDTYGQEPDVHNCGAVYEAIAPAAMAVNKPGEWNTYRVKLVGDTLDVWLNGTQIHKAQKLDGRGYFREPANALPLNTRATTGYIALQDHGHAFRYRNIRIRDLSPDPEPEGMRHLITGDLDDNWFATGAAEWKVEGGELVGRNGPGHLFTEDRFDDFEFRALVHVISHGNSGIYFRCEPNKDNPDTWPTDQGYEAQVDQHDPKNFTGCIYNRAWPEQQDKPITRDEAWFDYRIRAEGDHIRTWINGVPMVDTTLTEFDAGRFAVQGHHPGNVVRYRDVRVIELD